MTTSYRYIGTYSGGTGDIWTWAGPEPSVAFTAPGNLGAAVGVSAFDMGGSFAATPSDVLNTGSPYGSDELNLTSLLSTTSSYSVTNAPVFNWNGNSATPGAGMLDENISTFTSAGQQGLNVYDWLSPSAWGLVRDYELVATAADAPAGLVASVGNFQHVNIQASGNGAMIGLFSVQRGAVDLRNTTEQGVVIISPASSGYSESTFNVLASAMGDGITVTGPGAYTAPSTDYAGTPLVVDGSTSLLNFYDNGGGNRIGLSASQISSNLFMGAGSSQSTSGGGSMSFISSGTQAGVEAQVHAAGADLVQLNPTGSGAAHIYTDLASGLQDIEGFHLGRDMLDMTLPSPTSTTSSYSVASTNDSAWVSGTVGPSSSLGVIFTGISASAIVAHTSTTTVGGVTHLLIT